MSPHNQTPEMKTQTGVQKFLDRFFSAKKEKNEKKKEESVVVPEPLFGVYLPLSTRHEYRGLDGHALSLFQGASRNIFAAIKIKEGTQKEVDELLEQNKALFRHTGKKYKGCTLLHAFEGDDYKSYGVHTRHDAICMAHTLKTYGNTFNAPYTDGRIVYWDRVRKGLEFFRETKAEMTRQRLVTYFQSIEPKPE